jgi:hypothetical protein
MRKKQMRAISPNPSRPKDSRRRSLDRRFFQRFASDTHGGVMAYMGIMLPVMLGITGLALDGSLWYAQKRSVQAIADTAAYSVVLEVQRSGDTNLAKTAAKADAVTYGLDEATGDTITFNIPPKYGTFANTAGYYEVIIERPATIFLAGLLVDNFDTAARAVSGGGAASNPPCLLASDPSQKDAFKPDFNSDFQNIYLTQQVTPTALVVSTTIPGFWGQAACSRMLGVRATPAAWKTRPT